ncbi:MAG: hypothetical protein IJ920_03710 [Paludibacteraceae bacterium]|nr:hypothetical protein [Paludibacteraceae bacterium]
MKNYINNVLPKKVSDLVDDSGHYTKPSGGIPASDLADGVVPVEDVQVNGTSIVEDGVAEIPKATSNQYGVVKPGNGLGLAITSSGSLAIAKSSATQIKSGASDYAVIVPANQHMSIFNGLAKAAGEDMSSSSNAVGTYTDNAKSAIQNMLGISDGYVTKDSIDNAGITERTYTPVYGGEFTVTTATIDGYTHPTATIECETRPTFYSYRVSFTNNSTGETTEYIIPGRTWVENNGSLFSYLGNLQYFTAEIDMVPGGTDTQCPFLIKERYSDSKYYLDISTETAGSYTFLVEKISKTKTTIPSELIYGIETSPIKILRSSEAAKVFGLSIGAENFLYSHSNNVAIGNANVVSSSNSTAIGHFNQVQATGAIAEGYGAIANAPYSHATGYATLASGQYAHSEGYRTTASGNFSHAEGSQTTASGRFSHSAGGSTVANGYASCANGYFTKANSFGMYAIGENNVEDTIYEDWVSGTSYTIGDCVSYNGIGFKCTVANSDTTFNEEHWQFLKSNGSTAFVIGNGGVLTTDTPSNAYKVDWDGNGYYNGDVYVNCAADSTGGTKLISETDYATGQKAGLVRVYGNGVQMIGDRIAVTPPSDAQIKAGTAIYTPLGPAHQHKSVFYGLAKAAGDTTQSSSNNAVGTYTNEAKSAIRSMFGIENAGVVTVEVQGTSPSITAESNVRYTCGEVTSITITPPQIGICDVIFTSGSTPAILTLPNTIKMPDWVDLTILEANTIYEINIVDGIYGTVMTWKI